MAHRECIVCMDATVTHAFVPCGHYCVCGKCALTLRKDAVCPMCRQPVTDSMRIYDNSDYSNNLAIEEPLAPEPPNDKEKEPLAPEPPKDKEEEPLAPEPPKNKVEKAPEPLALETQKSFRVEVENFYDPKDFSSHGCCICPYLILGCCISVKWAEHWHECFVLSYNEKDGSHKCRYHGGRNGGLERTYHLNRKKFLVVSIPPSLLDSRLRNIELSQEYAGAVPKPQFLVGVHYQYDPTRYSQRLDNEALVGCQIGLRWTNGHYHTCQVQSYNSLDGTHTCLYSSGRRKHLHLNRCHFVMVSTFQQQSISLTGPPPTKDEVCPKTQMVDIMQARPWANVVPPKEPTRYPLL